MFGLTKLFSTEKKVARKSSFKPALEVLENREVLSTASPAVHAVTDKFGFNDAFFLQPAAAGQAPQLIESRNLLANGGPENTTIPTGLPNTPNGIQSFSAGLDAHGNADLFAKALDGSFWSYDGGWTKISLPGNSQVESFAAVDGGRVYAQFQDGSLNMFNSTRPANNLLSLSTWLHVFNAGSVTGLDAVTDTHGRDAVFVENADDSFGEFYNPNGVPALPPGLILPAGQFYVGPYTQLASPGHLTIVWDGHVVRTTFSQVSAFSVGTDANGDADVFATWWTGDLEKNVLGTGWTVVAAANTFESYSATDSGVAWVVSSAGNLERYNGSTFDPYTYGSGGIRSVAAASSLSAFTTHTNNDIEVYEMDPNAQNTSQQWMVGTTPN